MIKVSIIVLIGLVVATLLRRQSAALRHWVLALAIACAAAMPALQMLAPAWPIAMPAFRTIHQGDARAAAGTVSTAWQVDGPVTENLPVATSGSRAITPQSLERIWLAGVVVSFLMLLVAFGRLAWMTSRSHQVVDGTWSDMVTALSDRRKPRTLVWLLQTDHPTLLVTWGVMRPKIILPMTAREWPADRVRAVLGHELAHVRRRDWAVQMLAEFVKCVYWFNPLIWIACRRLRQESEKACDDAVLSMGMNAPEYATHLLDVARAFRHSHSRRSLFPAPAMARPSHLERRVRVMLNSGLSHAPLTRWAGIAVAMGLLGVTIPIASLVAASDAPQPALSQPNIAARSGSVAGSQVVSAPRIAVVTMEGGKKVSARLPPPGGSDVTDSTRTPPSTQAQAAVPVPVLVVAQTPTAACSGTLMDATGRAMSGVPIALVNSATAQRQETRTDEGGRFAISDLPAGEYQVEVTKRGFVTKQGRVVLAAGQQLQQDVVAQIGSLEETVVVQGGGAATPAAMSVPRVAVSAPPAAVGTRGTPAAVSVPRLAVVRPEADPCSQSTAGGCLTPPTKTVDMKPVFPPVHATDGVSGTVVVEARVGTDGFLKEFRTNDGADPAFAASALDAVRQWQFSPVRLNGIPQECRIKVTVMFVVVRN